MAILHSDQLEHSRRCGAHVRSAGEVGFLTNTTVAAANTLAAQKTAVDDSVVHADLIPAKDKIKQALDYGDYTDEFNDTDVAACTTVQGLVELTEYAYATDSSREQQFS